MFVAVCSALRAREELSDVELSGVSSRRVQREHGVVHGDLIVRVGDDGLLVPTGRAGFGMTSDADARGSPGVIV